MSIILYTADVKFSELTLSCCKVLCPGRLGHHSVVVMAQLETLILTSTENALKSVTFK